MEEDEEGGRKDTEIKQPPPVGGEKKQIAIKYSRISHSRSGQ